jgi:hypothetical protein
VEIWKKETAEDVSPEAKQIFEKAIRLLDDETAQNNALPEDRRRVLFQNPACDFVPKGFGEFGRTVTNPVPVNGVMGELIYLLRLETADGIPIAFHRLGACNRTDVFEIVSEDGRHWDLLYVSLYYPRRSRAVPSGYQIMTDKVRRSLIRGTTLHVGGFPKGIFSAAAEAAERMVGIGLVDLELNLWKRVTRLFDQESISKPYASLSLLAKPRFALTAATAARNMSAMMMTRCSGSSSMHMIR